MRISVGIMNWSPEIKTFILQHLEDDTDKLLLSARRFSNIDVPFAVDQILARRQLKNKLPHWYQNDDVIMGGRIPAEQCSSEHTAVYKRSLVKGSSLCDLTGGMGVDLFYMSRGLEKAIYVERQPGLCETAIHNFDVLGADNIQVIEGDGLEMQLPFVDTIYLDPARRAADGSRVYDLTDCEPNVVEWQDELLRHCSRLIVKMSPMVDLSRVLKLIPSVVELHIVGIKGECKEVIAVCEDDNSISDVLVKCVDFKSTETLSYSYNLSEEIAAESVFASQISRYLYEPDVTILKAGAYKSLCKALGVEKLDVNSHLYTSSELVGNFPGRIFELEETYDFSSKILKNLKKTIPQANITARNFVLTADQLRSRSGIKDGGNVYLFASMLKGVGNIIMRCHKVLSVLLLALFCVGEIAAQSSDAKKAVPTSIEQLLSGIAVASPSQWHQGMEFVFLSESINMLMLPEERFADTDTVNYRGSIWNFDAIVSEEDWMGQQTMALRFISPLGRAYRYSTDRLMEQLSDTAYIPLVPGLYPKQIVDQAGERLNARTLYILINDDRISDGDSLKFEKFVPVLIDSVTFGTELAPLEIHYSYESGDGAFVRTSLPGARENATSTTITRFFSVSDPYLQYPNIALDTWKRIQRNEVTMDMTREECRLSLGKPLRFETYNSRSGAVERWFYLGGRVYEFWDGRLTRIGREK